MSAALATSVEIDQCDGFLVVSRRMRSLQVKPPYQYSYSVELFADLNDAADHYDDLERGEMGSREPVAILPCKGGVPLGAKELSHLTLTRLCKERAA